jgi:hypothetical protein
METNISKVGTSAIVKDEGSSSILTVVGAFEAGNSSTPASNLTVREPKDPIENNSKPWSLWGDDDQWPQDLIEKLSYLGVAKSALDINSDLHYGSGIQWMSEKASEDGTLKHIVSNPNGWRRYAMNSGFNRGISESINSTDTSGLAFVRFTLNRDKTVHRMDVLDFPSVRLGKRNKAGKIEKVYYHPEIYLKSGKDDGVVIYNVYNEGDHDTFINNNNVFVYLVRSRTWGRFYYPEPNYYATIKNGWADIVIEVPKLIKYIYKNQATLKYHIKIPISVFKMRFKCWEEKTEKEQLQLFADYKAEIENAISKAEAAGASVFSIYQDEYPNVEITPIKDALDNSKDLPNNVAANSEILFAIGVAPALLGLNMPGGKDLNGSGGSQLRESLKAKQATLTRERIYTLELAYFVARLNKYPEEIYPMFIDIDISQTLDENPTGKKTVVGG